MEPIPRHGTLFQQIPIRDRDPAEHGTDDAEKPLVCSAEVQISQWRQTVGELLRCSVNAAVQMTGEASDRSRGEDVCVDNVSPEIRNVLDRRLQDLVIPVILRRHIVLFRQMQPVVRICQGRDPHSPVFQRLRIVEVVR